QAVAAVPQAVYVELLSGQPVAVGVRPANGEAIDRLLVAVLAARGVVLLRRRARQACETVVGVDDAEADLRRAGHRPTAPLAHQLVATEVEHVPMVVSRVVPLAAEQDVV